MLGFIIGISTDSVGGRYVSMFLMAIGYAGGDHLEVSLIRHSLGGLGFSMTLVWVSNVIPRPPAYDFVVVLSAVFQYFSLNRKRAAAMGVVNGIGNLGNLYAL
jgi:hypothetical protein